MTTLKTTLPNGITITTGEPARGEHGWVAHISVSGMATFHLPRIDDPAEVQERIHQAAERKFGGCYGP